MTPSFFAIYPFFKEIYALLEKIYTHLHKVGAGGQKHFKLP